MFTCEFGNHPSQLHEPLKIVVTSWRKREYPAVELPKKFGDFQRRFSQSGIGYEPKTVKKACGAHAVSHPNAVLPDMSRETGLNKPDLSTSDSHVDNSRKKHYGPSVLRRVMPEMAADKRARKFQESKP